MIIPLFLCLSNSPLLAFNRPAPDVETSSYLQYRTWNNQHWRAKAVEKSKIVIQHLPDMKTVSEDKNVEWIEYRNGSGANYTAIIEERNEKSGKTYIIMHVSQDGKEKHYDRLISYIGWDDKPHVSSVVDVNGRIAWKTETETTTTTTVATPTAPKPAVAPTPAKTKTGN